MLTDGTNVFPVAVHLPAPVRFHIAFPSAVGISAIKTRAAGACAGVDAGVGIVGGAVVKIAIVGDVEVATASGGAGTGADSASGGADADAVIGSGVGAVLASAVGGPIVTAAGWGAGVVSS